MHHKMHPPYHEARHFSSKESALKNTAGQVNALNWPDMQFETMMAWAVAIRVPDARLLQNSRFRCILFRLVIRRGVLIEAAGGASASMGIGAWA